MSKLLNKSWVGILLTTCVLLFGTCSGVAQVDTGTILGTVKDQTGAVIPDARVTITNQGTSEQFTTMTRSDGTYIVTPLKIGTYRISVEHAGFSTAENAAFELNIQQQAVVDFELRAGSTSQTVQVTAQAALLQTQNAVVGQVIGATTVENMPLNGRDWTMLATLTPGVTQPQQGAGGQPVCRQRYPPCPERLPSGRHRQQQQRCRFSER
jgi:hypothetical protein